MLHQPFGPPALILLGLSLPLVLGLIPRNRFYGFRTKLTMSDDRMWYTVNRCGGVAIGISSALYLVLARIAPHHPCAQDAEHVWLVHLAGFAGPLLLSLVVTAVYSRRRARRDGSQSPGGHR